MDIGVVSRCGAPVQLGLLEDDRMSDIGVFVSTLTLHST
jgi:hypothetical protein